MTLKGPRKMVAFDEGVGIPFNVLHSPVISIHNCTGSLGVLLVTGL